MAENSKKREKISEEELQKIKKFLEELSFGSVTIIVQDGKIVQIEKNEKIRLTRTEEELRGGKKSGF